MGNETRDSSDLERNGSDSFEGEQHGLLSGLVESSKHQKRTMVTKAPIILLILSLIANVLQVVSVKRNSSSSPECVSQFAKIPEREKTQILYYNTEYTAHSSTEEEKEALWQNIDYSEGFIAVSHEEVDELGWPRSATFPWDANKGIYVVHGYHQLHCVTLLHAYTHAVHLGQEPIVSYHHIEHCLDMLRQDFLCIADDTLDYTANNGPHRKTGDNQPRQCRDWSKLSDWARDHSACYKTYNITYAGQDFGVSHQLDRYTFCPEGSPYAELVQTYKDMSRANPGNLDKEAVQNKSAEEKAHMLALLEAHNAHIADGSPSYVDSTLHTRPHDHEHDHEEEH